MYECLVMSSVRMTSSLDSASWMTVTKQKCSSMPHVTPPNDTSVRRKARKICSLLNRGSAYLGDRRTRRCIHTILSKSIRKEKLTSTSRSADERERGKDLSKGQTTTTPCVLAEIANNMYKVEGVGSFVSQLMNRVAYHGNACV